MYLDIKLGEHNARSAEPTMLKKSCLWLILTLCMTLSGGYSEATEPKIINEKDVNSKALEFTCARGREARPTLDPEADQWFQEAIRLYNTGNENFDARAKGLLLKAAERNHVQALTMYLRANGADADEAKAVDYAARLIKMDVGMGYYYMGHFLDRGTGVKQDQGASLVHFIKAAELWNAEGKEEVGKKLLGDFLQTPLRDQAVPIGIKILECSLAQGWAESGYELSLYFLIIKKDLTAGLQSLQRAAALGHSLSLYKLSATFEKGEYGLEKDPIRATCYKTLKEEADADETKRFPNIDKICPLPSRPMPKSPA